MTEVMPATPVTNNSEMDTTTVEQNNNVVYGGEEHKQQTVLPVGTDPQPSHDTDQRLDIQVKTESEGSGEQNENEGSTTESTHHSEEQKSPSDSHDNEHAADGETGDGSGSGDFDDDDGELKGSKVAEANVSRCYDQVPLWAGKPSDKDSHQAYMLLEMRRLNDNVYEILSVCKQVLHAVSNTLKRQHPDVNDQAVRGDDAASMSRKRSRLDDISATLQMQHNKTPEHSELRQRLMMGKMNFGAGAAQPEMPSMLPKENNLNLAALLSQARPNVSMPTIKSHDFNQQQRRNESPTFDAPAGFTNRTSFIGRRKTSPLWKFYVDTGHSVRCMVMLPTGKRCTYERTEKYNTNMEYHLKKAHADDGTGVWQLYQELRVQQQRRQSLNASPSPLSFQGSESTPNDGAVDSASNFRPPEQQQQQQGGGSEQQRQQQQYAALIQLLKAQQNNINKMNTATASPVPQQPPVSKPAESPLASEGGRQPEDDDEDLMSDNEEVDVTDKECSPVADKFPLLKQGLSGGSLPTSCATSCANGMPPPLQRSTPCDNSQTASSASSTASTTGCSYSCHFCPATFDSPAKAQRHAMHVHSSMSYVSPDKTSSPPLSTSSATPQQQQQELQQQQQQQHQQQQHQQQQQQQPVSTTTSAGSSPGPVAGLNQALSSLINQHLKKGIQGLSSDIDWAALTNGSNSQAQQQQLAALNAAIQRQADEQFKQNLQQSNVRGFSRVWQWFVYKQATNKSECQICLTELAGKYTSNLQKHLRCAHPETFEEMKRLDRQQFDALAKTIVGS